MKAIRHWSVVGCLTATLGACVSVPAERHYPLPEPAPLPQRGPQSMPAPGPAPLPTPSPLPPARPAAVQSLLDAARADLSGGALAAASAKLERALRLSPRDGWLWHELAQVRLAEGDPTQARALAARSNALAGNDQTLRTRNARLLDLATP